MEATTLKISVQEILKSSRFAIRITNLKQIIILLPECKILEDLELFFSVDPNHSEYLGTVHTTEKGFHLGFVHKENKQIVNYDDLETH